MNDLDCGSGEQGNKGFYNKLGNIVFVLKENVIYPQLNKSP